MEVKYIFPFLMERKHNVEVTLYFAVSNETP